MEHSELLPCPLCNGDVKTGNIGQWEKVIKCSCGLTFDGCSEEDLIKAWNTRPVNKVQRYEQALKDVKKHNETSVVGALGDIPAYKFLTSWQIANKALKENPTDDR